MTRKTERLLIKLGACWNILNGALTLFFYSPYLRNHLFADMGKNTKGLNYLSENVYSVVTIYGLVFILLGAVHFYLATRMKDQTVQYAFPIWCCLFGFVSYFSVDPISAILFTVAGVFSLTKNKATKAYLANAAM